MKSEEWVLTTNLNEIFYECCEKRNDRTRNRNGRI